MHLYHYSLKSDGRYDKLRTERQRNNNKSQSTPLEFPSYDNHISFFFERPPLELLPDMYLNKGYEHPFWKNGNVVYEYTVDTSSLHGYKKLYYEIVETPGKTALMLDDAISEERYEVLKAKLYLERGYTGSSLQELEKAWSRLSKNLKKGWMLDAYKTMMETKGPYGFESNKAKYAPMVTHLMLYLDPGTVRYSHTQEIVMGKSNHSNQSNILTNWK